MGRNHDCCRRQAVRAIERAGLVTAILIAPLLARRIAAEGPVGDRQQIFNRRLDSADSTDRLTTTAVFSGPARHQGRFERWDPLDDQIRSVSRQLAALEREPDFAPVNHPAQAALEESRARPDLLPLSFQIMGLLSLVLAGIGLAVIMVNRPTLSGLRSQ